MKLTDKELDSLLAKANLKIAEPYSENCSYNKSKHILTECQICGLKAHYTLQYILDKTGKEPVCRAEYWRAWYDYSYALSHGTAVSSSFQPLSSFAKEIHASANSSSVSAAKAHAKKYGLDLMKLIPGKRSGEDLYQVKCPICGKISIERKGDVAWGCSCKSVPPSHTGKKSGDSGSTVKLLSTSNAECVAWWDHAKNDERAFHTARYKARGIFWWKCSDCGLSFQSPVYAMTRQCACPACEEQKRLFVDEMHERYKRTPCSAVPDLLEAWDDERDPSKTMVYPTGWNAMSPGNGQYRFKCKNGHHPYAFPMTYLLRGCPACRAAATRAASVGRPVFLRHSSPELALEWSPKNDARISPDNTKLSSKRPVIWKCTQCGHEWRSPVYQRDRRYGQACPSCGKVLNSFAWQYPGLASEWSPNNPVSPWTIYPGATLQFVPEWICKNNPNHIWKAGLAGRVQGGECPECRETGRSRIAMRYFGFVKDAFDNARCEIPLFNSSFSHNPWPVDMLFENGDATVVVEYDGAYWHSSRAETDLRKSLDLLNAGYHLVRLREDDLQSLPINQKEYYELNVSSQSPNCSNTVASIKKWLSSL